jgi:hypothetical protein
LRTVLRRGFQSFEVLKWHESNPEDSIGELRDRTSVLDSLLAFLHDPLNMLRFRMILNETSLYGDVSRLSNPQVLELLAWQIVSGRLRILELPLLEIGPSTASSAEYLREPPAREIKPKKEEEKSWIEIELLDEENRPVAGERYRIILPDGNTIAEGTTDAIGLAAIRAIDPGICKITFPDLDKADWKKA